MTAHASTASTEHGQAPASGQEGRVNENEPSNALEQDPFRFQPVALLPSVPA